MRKINIIPRDNGRWLVSGDVDNQFITDKQLHKFLVCKKDEGFNIKFVCAPR